MYCSGVVTFNPDIQRLRENIDSIAPQVQELVIFDNGSENADEIKSEFGERCTVLCSVVNLGIAAALNEICRYAQSKGYEWVLTLDDDSVCPPNLIEEYSKHIESESVGILSPRIVDRNIGDIECLSSAPVDDVDSCISSASLLSLNAWREVGGFWEDLFIDMVDYDLCWSLREKGYRILRVNGVSLLHEIGHSSRAVFRNKTVAILNHSPRRYYYIFRNTIAVGRKHHRRIQCFRWNCKRFWLIIRYESGRLPKLAAAFRGVFHASINKLGPAL